MFNVWYVSAPGEVDVSSQLWPHDASHSPGETRPHLSPRGTGILQNGSRKHTDIIKHDGFAFAVACHSLKKLGHS